MTDDKWNAKLYDGEHSFVAKYGENLIGLLAPQKGERILDLGCGTGDLAYQIHALGADVLGLDSSEKMIEQARKKYPYLSFYEANALNLHFENEFDAVFSNAVLHWIKPPEQVLEGIYKALKKGGRFVAEFGGKGNVQMIVNAALEIFRKEGIKNQADRIPWYFPSIGEYASMMEKVGFRVTAAFHFDRPTPLLGTEGLRKWLKMFGHAMFQDLDDETKEKIMSEIEDHLKEKMFKNGQWIADYKRIRIMGNKE